MSHFHMVQSDYTSFGYHWGRKVIQLSKETDQCILLCTFHLFWEVNLKQKSPSSWWNWSYQRAEWQQVRSHERWQSENWVEFWLMDSIFGCARPCWRKWLYFDWLITTRHYPLYRKSKFNKCISPQMHSTQIETEEIWLTHDRLGKWL